MGTARIGFVVFPRLTQLDLTGPFEVLSRVPSAETLLVGSDRSPVRSDTGLELRPDAGFAAAPGLDVICVPGGPGVNAAMEDPELLAFLRSQAASAKWVTSVCTGALVLGAAGLLRGYRATTHWLSHDFLAAFGAIPVRERVVIDRNRITGAGVTAGIDFGLRLAAQLAGDEVARRIQLQLEYDPAPPFEGSPEKVRPEIVGAAKEAWRALYDERAAVVGRAASKM
jgi:cyclohexyl-isocyanide hydratase